MHNSYTAHIKKEMIATRAVICEILSWTEIDFTNFQYRIGTQYLQSYLSKEPVIVDELIASRIFWNWWRNEWLLRDKNFLYHAMNNDNLAVLSELYVQFHNVEVLLSDIYPCAIVLNQSYARMMGSYQKSLHV